MLRDIVVGMKYSDIFPGKRICFVIAWKRRTDRKRTCTHTPHKQNGIGKSSQKCSVYLFHEATSSILLIYAI